ncbi:MAG TPA: DUF1587 domain-containing protein, partial [Polyangiaceae bacterium]|nr:DUF1587 domain-containing protein [Polyangiaceae bacterium]
MSRSLSLDWTKGLLVGAIFASASCTGMIGAPDNGVNAKPAGGAAGNGTVGGAGTGGAGGGGAGGAAGSGGAGGGLDCTAPSPGPSYARRLNRFEYNNTVRDLLGDQTAPADDF